MQYFVITSCEFLDTETGNIGVLFVEDEAGECVRWQSDQAVVTGAQAALAISTVAGAGAGAMILLEWLCCEVCCAGCLEGLGFLAAWVVGAGVFQLYGKKNDFKRFWHIPRIQNVSFWTERTTSTSSDFFCVSDFNFLLPSTATLVHN